MKIPKTIKVGAHVYGVKYEKDLTLNHDLVGQSRHQHGEIILDPNQSQSQLEDTLLHEILHAINSQVTFIEDKDDAEEKAISRISPLLLQVIKDNPEFFHV